MSSTGGSGDMGQRAAAETPWAARRAREMGLGKWPDVIRELEAGRGFAAHARLRSIRRKTPAGGERECIDAALAEPRLFAEPMRSTPGLHRVNGVGPSMFGGSHRDRSDGSYVKTRWLTFLFVPVLPLDAWIVSDAPGGGWYFHARVPVEGTARLVRVAGLGALVAAMLGGVAAVLYAATHSDLHVLNGLDVPAEVVVDDGDPIVAEPGGHATVTVSSGSHRFRCNVAGQVLDDRTEDVSGSADLVVYNVGGASPVFVEDVEYRDESSRPRKGDDRQPRIESFVGQPFVQRSQVEFVFEPAPTTISLDKGSTSAVRRHAGVFDGGWRAAVGFALERSDAKAAEAVLVTVARSVGDDADAVQELSTGALRIGGAATAVRVGEALVAARPQSAAARRALLEARIWSGRTDTAAAELKEALAASPDSPQLQVLLARVSPRAEAGALVDAAWKRASADPFVQDCAFRVRHRIGRRDEAAADAERILAARNPKHTALFANCAKALYAAARAEKALDGLEAVIADRALLRDDAEQILGAYERVRLAAGDTVRARRSAFEWVPAVVASRVDADDDSEEAAEARREASAATTQWVALFARDARGVSRTQSAPVAAGLAVWRDAATAVERHASVTPEIAGGIDPVLQIQFGAELARVGRTQDAAVVHAAMPPWVREDFRDPTFARLPDVAGFEAVNDDASTAALLLAWAARETDAAKRDALLARARELDVCGDAHAWSAP